MSTDLDAQHLYMSSWENKSPNKEDIKREQTDPKQINLKKTTWGLVLQQLRETHFFLSKSRVDLFSKNVDCLGHVIDDKGIHTESDKMQHIRVWRTPQNYNEVHKFLGLVQYLAQFMLYVTAYTTPLSGLAHNNWKFQWTPLLDKCFESIKTLAFRTPTLKPIDFSTNELV